MKDEFDKKKMNSKYFIWWCRVNDRFYGKRDIGTPDRLCPHVIIYNSELWSDYMQCHVASIYIDCPLTCEKEGRAKGCDKLR